MNWIAVGTTADLQANSGVCALIEGQQIALFYLPEQQAIYALNNYDPIGKANVLSRGIVGDLQGQCVVASPLYKQHFNLQTGVCLENDQIQVPSYAVKIENETVFVGL